MIRAPLTRKRMVAQLAACAALLAVVLLASVLVPAGFGSGAPRLGPGEAASALLGGGDDLARIIVWQARIPRGLLAAACGASLGLAGAILQVVLRNPLADPHVLGVSAGAALGAVAGIGLGASVGGAGHPVAAIVGAAIASLVVHALARDAEGRLSVERLIVAGVVLSYLLAAGIMWIVSLAPAQRGQHFLFWLMGSFASASLASVVGVTAALVAAVILMAPVLGALNLLAVSEEHAADAGVEVERAKLVAAGAAAILTGGAVAAAGSIGFVGLVVPHSVRLVLGHDARLLVPASALAGAAFLVAADALVRALGEVPVGVVTASCGAPFFLWLLWRRRPA